VTQEREDRVERGGDEILEPTIDGGLDVPGDVE